MKLVPADGALLRLVCRWANDQDIVGEFQRPYGWSPRRLRHDLSTRVWVIVQDRRRVGFCYAQRRRFGVTEIGVTILPPFRGGGLGTQAHTLLLEAIRSADVRTFQAITAAANVAERRLLIRLGFTVHEEIVSDYAPCDLLILRRSASARRSGVLVVFVVGPAGVGKSALCSALKPLLRESLGNPRTPILSVWGDMFSHLSYPWIADAVQLDRKYTAMRNVLDALLREPDALVLVDDLCRRPEDLISLCAHVEARGATTLVLALDATEAQLLERNRDRYQSEILPDDVVRELAGRTRIIMREVSGAVEVTAIDNRLPLNAVAEGMRDLIVSTFRRSSSTASPVEP